jgi:hypothetical protein
VEHHFEQHLRLRPLLLPLGQAARQGQLLKKFAVGAGTKVAAPDVSDVVLDDANTYAF